MNDALDAVLARLAELVAERIVAKLPAAPAPAPAEPADGREWLDQKQAALFLGCSEKFLEEARARGDGPPVRRLGKRALRFSKTELMEWMRRSGGRPG